MGKRRRTASSATARGARARKIAKTKHAKPIPDLTPVLSLSNLLECIGNVLSDLGPSVDSVSESVSSALSKDETPTKKSTTVCRPPVEVDYKTLRHTLRESPEHFETMLLQTIDLVHDLWHNSHILHGNITPDVIMCDIVDNNPQFFFVDLDHGPGAAGVDPLDPTKSRSGHLATSFPFMSHEVADNLNPQYRRALPHEPAYDFTALFWVAVWCVNMVEDVEVVAVVDEWNTDDQTRIPIWKDEELDDIGYRKEWILDCYAKARLSPTPAFEQHLPMLERWRDIHARVRTQTVNSRRNRRIWREPNGLIRVRIYDPIYTDPIERSTIRQAILNAEVVV